MALEILQQRCCQDCIIALATQKGDIPCVREVDAWYEDGSFYIITSAQSEKLKQIAGNPRAGVAGQWFEGFGKAFILGDYRNPENDGLRKKLLQKFAWFDDHPENYPNPYTVFIRIVLEEVRISGPDWPQEYRAEFPENYLH